ncbi:TPA: DNA mismatch repair protein MutT, partial [Streptococcus agalactiae]|nr:DNA mismatch repair protein MutT [Streptococcus agalactiae]
DLAYIVENQFNIKRHHYHSVEFLYFVNLLGQAPESIKEGTHKRHFVWLPIKELTKIDCNPNFLAQDLIEWPGHVVHKIVQN